MHNALKKTLLEAGGVGLDMSPGDPIALEALAAMKFYETRIKELELKLEIKDIHERCHKLAVEVEGYEEKHELYHHQD